LYDAYTDFVAPLFNAVSLIAALDYRRRTGKGLCIDQSQHEAVLQCIAPLILGYAANGTEPRANGNRLDYAAPHGIYRCQGDDRWCAIAVFTDGEWEAFCHAIGDPAWTKEPRFATLNSRKENEDALEELVSEWTKQHSAEEVMQIMQVAGVPAGVVQTVQDLLENDPQLKERKLLLPLKHPVMGVFTHPTPPFKLLKTKAQVRTSPCLGEHTEYVCTEFLGMSHEVFAKLSGQGVFK